MALFPVKGKQQMRNLLTRFGGESGHQAREASWIHVAVSLSGQGTTG